MPLKQQLFYLSHPILYQWHTTYSLQSGNNVTVWTLGWETCTWDHQDQRFTLDTFSQYAAHSSLFYPSKELGFTMNTHIVHQGPTRQCGSSGHFSYLW